MRGFFLFAALTALLFALSAPLSAQQNSRPILIPVKSTPDQTVSATATTEVIFKTRVEYIAIKNECASDLYFDLGGYDFSESNPTTPNAYSVRLASSEAFSGYWRVLTLGVSPASGNTAACTFSVVVGR
tara:strand:- start:3016 stop:3402 length:387 start_codon:yes stop_codon:yes gene_type:complete